jgi:hypothetical protein
VVSGPFAQVQGSHSGPLDLSNSETVAVDINVDGPGPSDARGRAKTWAVFAGVACSVLVIAAGVRIATKRRVGSRSIAYASEATEATSAPASNALAVPYAVGTETRSLRTPVHFLLTTDPSGAHVFYKGKDVGVTPFVFDVRPEGDEGSVNVELTFVKSGYQTEKVVTGGSGEVVLRQKLQKKPPPKPPAPPPAVAAARAEAATPVALVVKNTDPVPFTEGMTRPERLKGKNIQYTPEALAANVEGVMKVKCIITVQGHVEVCKVLETLPHMEQAVLDALTSRTYSPATLHGRPVAVEYTFNIRLHPPK